MEARTHQKPVSFDLQAAIESGLPIPIDIVQPTTARVRHKVRGLGFRERKLLQGLVDWLGVMACVSIIFGQSSRDYDKAEMYFSLGVISVLWFFFADAFDTYSLPNVPSRFRVLYATTQLLVAVGVSYIVLSWFAGGFLPIIRPRISEFFTASLLLIPLLLLHWIVARLLLHAPLRRRIAIVGANYDGYEMLQALSRHSRSYEFVGYFDDAPASGSDEKWVSGHITRSTSILPLLCDASELDQILLANPQQTTELLYNLSLCHERGIQITPMFALYQDLMGRLPVSHLGDAWYAALPANVKHTTRPYKIAKRMLDVCLAVVGLVMTTPLIPLVALAIKLDSPGPVLFKQVRVGRGGKLFKIVKFRTMRQDAEASTGAVWAQNKDVRITRIGRFLRKSRLDEIPQLWNIIVGDMSFVGPRPERPEFDEQLEREIPFYRARRAVRPGLTGWAQVSYGYGNSMLDALRKVEYDLFYIKRESLYIDLLILLRTVSVVLRLGGK
ncbi:MAG: sugar transferase [Chloroflexota bacterium]